MTAHEFQNALRIMMSLDEVSSVLGKEMVRVFHNDPMRAAVRMDEDTWARVYALIEARQPKEKT